MKDDASDSNAQERAGASTTVVVGEGWSALAVLAYELTQTVHSVTWVAGSGSRLRAPLPGTAASGRDWARVAGWLGIETSEWNEAPAAQAALREYKNKAFKPLTAADWAELREELWAPEQRWGESSEGRFERPFCELEDAARAVIAEFLADPVGSSLRRPEGAGAFRRIVGAPVNGIRVEDGALRALILGSGEEIACARLYACDRWAELPAWSGLPKGLPFLRKRDAHGVLQATFTHAPEAAALFAGLSDGYFTALHKEAGQEQVRHVWGGFHSSLTGALQSTWSVCLAPEEVADNHMIAKQFRRMKAGLEKMFAGVIASATSAASGEGATRLGDFQSTILEESVRFEEEAVFAGGEPPRGTTELPRVEGVYFLTDGYGPAQAVVQAAQAQGWEPLVDPSAERRLGFEAAPAVNL